MTGGYRGGNRLQPSGPTTFGGQRWPDIVGALHVKQGWGEAQISGVIHNVNVEGLTASPATSAAAASRPSPASCNAQQNKVGWGIDAGVKFNLPWRFGAGDDVLLTGSYTQNAVWYSGLPDVM